MVYLLRNDEHGLRNRFFRALIHQTTGEPCTVSESGRCSIDGAHEHDRDLILKLGYKSHSDKSLVLFGLIHDCKWLESQTPQVVQQPAIEKEEYA